MIHPLPPGLPGVAGLRLEADAVLDLWRGDDGQTGGDVAAARQEILGTAERVTAWYDGLATILITGGELPRPRHRRAARRRPHHPAVTTRRGHPPW